MRLEPYSSVADKLFGLYIDDLDVDTVTRRRIYCGVASENHFLYVTNIKNTKGSSIQISRVPSIKRHHDLCCGVICLEMNGVATKVFEFYSSGACRDLLL